MLAPPLARLLLGDMSQLVDLWCLASHDALSHLNASRDWVTSCNCVLRSLRLDSDDSDTRIVLRAVMSAVLEVAEPGLQRGRVVLLHC